MGKLPDKKPLGLLRRLNRAIGPLARWLEEQPETQWFADANERDRAIRQIAKRYGLEAMPARSACMAVLIFVVAVIAAALVEDALAKALAGAGSSPPMIVHWLDGALVGGTVAFFVVRYDLVRRRAALRALRERLRELGVRVCLHCGYNLTGNVSGVCPECGERTGGFTAENAESTEEKERGGGRGAPPGPGRPCQRSVALRAARLTAESAETAENLDIG
jgi:hypothetical protein